MITKFLRLAPLAALSLLTSLPFSPAHAAWEVFPKNHHQLYQAYSLLFDQQTTVLWYGQARTLGSVGGSFPVAGNSDSDLRPQFLIHGSATAAMRFSDSGRIYSDTIDARAGFYFDFSINPAFRVSTGFMHYSGHAADGALDRALLDDFYNLGDNILQARLVYDLANYARLGGTGMWFLRNTPSKKTFGGNFFAEFFPWGGQDERGKISPYVGASLELVGVDAYGYTPALNFQIGAYLGNHFTGEFKQTLRPVLGYFTGMDPRMKYAQYRDAKDSFFYFGIMVDI
jgi:hypothetical protein